MGLPPSKDMAAFKELLSSSKHIIAVAGAGLSAASGIPTFRGSGGLWRKYDAMSLASYESIRKQIAPDATFTLITQNVDGLSPRALEQVRNALPVSESQPPSQPQTLEMHGRVPDVLCTSESCGHSELVLRSPICAALGGTEHLVEQGVIEPIIDEADLPRCTKCGALARPGVVWFGEEPHYLPIIDRLVDQANLCLVVGTSSTVYPAASYGTAVRRHGGKVVVFNLERSNGDEDADFLFLGPCEETIPEALGV